MCGYFNPRPNTGVLDDLSVRTVLFKLDNQIGGLVVFDLCFLSADIVNAIRAGLSRAGLDFGGNLIFSATHTHTGPYVDDFFGTQPDPGYLNALMEKAVLSVRQAYSNLGPAALSLGRVKNNPLAFNRRFWMKNGQVMTNPGKLNPDIVRPEGPVDNEIGVLAVEQGGRISAILAHIVNHTDTVGGDLVSADWPGRMERAIQTSLGYDLPVLTLIGCSGNINHLDVSNADEYYGYAEACRIGRAYADIVCGLLAKRKKLPVSHIAVHSAEIAIPYRTIPDEHVKQAEAALARIGQAASDGDMTSEGLATQDGPVARFFAAQLIEYARKCSGRSRDFSLLSMHFDDQLAFVSLPGEPFTEIGLELKKRSPARKTWPIALAMGECGYIPMPECFQRGGYETLPVVGGSPREDTAARIVEEAVKLLHMGRSS